MTDEATDQPPGREPRPSLDPPRARHWWEQQKWVLPIAVVVLSVAVFGITMWLRADREQAAAEAPGGSEAPASEQQAAASPSPSAPASETPAAQQQAERQRQQDRKVARVCDRIITFQRDVQDGGITPLDLYTQLSNIEQQARGTRLDDDVNEAVRTIQRFVTGQADGQVVVDAGRRLASSC